MVPPIGRSLEPTKLKVTGTAVRPARRSLRATENETKETCVNMPPDETGG